MLMGLLIKSMGFVFSVLPYSFLEFAVEALGYIFVSTPSNRRRLLFSNLKHAFPEWSHAKIKSVARKSSVRMFEMGFFSLTYPFLSKEKRKRTVLYSKQVEGQLEEYRRCGSPVLILLPHLCLFETLATSPYFRPQGGKSLGAIYRPNKNPVMDRWINQARLETGVRTFARKAGLLKARDHLRNGNWLVVLFDQNAGLMGNRTFFFDRLCSISPLPDLLGKTPDARCFYAFPKRTGFFQSQLELRAVPKSAGGFSADSHKMLENDLKRCTDGLPEWLWSHGKWKTNEMPHEFFHLQKNDRSKGANSLIPQKTKIWIRMPNWLGDIVMALPLIRAIRSGRPDASITLLCKNQYVDFLESLGLSEAVLNFPDEKGLGYFSSVLKWRKNYPDAMLVLTNSLRGDLEAFLIGAKLRMGMASKCRRPLLNATWAVPKKADSWHQTKIWEELIRNFGVTRELDLSPIQSSLESSSDNFNLIGVAPGSLNTPQKRLPVDHWVRIVNFLNRKYPQTKVIIFGSQAESSLCSEVFAQVDNRKCQNLSGSTSILELSKHFRNLKLLLCNDSGAMHLANALGVPVFAVFGTTSKQKTGPIFEAETKVHEVGSGDLQNLPESQAKKMILDVEKFCEGLE